jgi:hypothetical protein
MDVSGVKTRMERGNGWPRSDDYDGEGEWMVKE